MIEPAHPQLSIRRQCALLGLARSTLYDQPLGDSAENLQLMRLLDEQYTATVRFYRRAYYNRSDQDAGIQAWIERHPMR